MRNYVHSCRAGGIAPADPVSMTGIVGWLRMLPEKHL